MIEETPTNIIKLRTGGYRAVFNDVELTVPEDAGNRHYLTIQEAISNGETITEEQQIITAQDVKSEAQRRILHILPEWKQRNLTARAAELAIKGVQNWSLDEQAEVVAGQALWDQIKIVRTKSDELEAMNPIPIDYSDDKYWT